MFVNILEQIEYVRGAAAVEQSEDGFALSRMTPELAEFYNYSEPADIRACCPSGVRIGFVSDTAFLAMRMRFGRICRPIYTVDVVIDGERKETFNGEPDDFAFNMEIPGEGEKQIEIFLPYAVECLVCGIEIADGSTLSPLPESDKRMMFIGDSITQGMTSSSPCMIYPAQLALALKYDFHNIAVGGATMLADVGRMALELDWNMAFVAFGTNDFNGSRPLADFEQDTRGMLEHLSTRENAEIYLITVIPWAGRAESNTLGLDLADYRQALRDAAADFRQVKVIEGAELVPDDATCFVDNVHPNDRGMTLYAENLLKILRSSGNVQ